jgi:hypothetical protein
VFRKKFFKPDVLSESSYLSQRQKQFGYLVSFEKPSHWSKGYFLYEGPHHIWLGRFVNLSFGQQQKSRPNWPNYYNHLAYPRQVVTLLSCLGLIQKMLLFKSQVDQACHYVFIIGKSCLFRKQSLVLEAPLHLNCAKTFYFILKDFQSAKGSGTMSSPKLKTKLSEWSFSDPLLASLPIDTETENFIRRDAPKSVFSIVRPTPFKTKPKLVAFR